MKLAWNKGSEWHRWDPHVHTPSTLFNNQFKGDWSGFISAIENVPPTVEAVEVTDYCVLEGYEDFCQYWEAGRAKNVRFVFPKIEFRLSVETEKKKGINLHLLFSPDDPEHVNKIERALGYLTFAYWGHDVPMRPRRFDQPWECFRPVRDQGKSCS